MHTILAAYVPSWARKQCGYKWLKSTRNKLTLSKLKRHFWSVSYWGTMYGTLQIKAALRSIQWKYLLCRPVAGVIPHFSEQSISSVWASLTIYPQTGWYFWLGTLNFASNLWLFFDYWYHCGRAPFRAMSSRSSWGPPTSHFYGSPQDSDFVWSLNLSRLSLDF